MGITIPSYTSLLPLGATASGNVDGYGSYSWWRVDLIVDQGYSFTLDQGAPPPGSIYATLDPLLKLYDASGTFLLSDDNGGINWHSSRIFFQPGCSGTYYLAATGAPYLDSRGSIGTYIISASQTSTHPYITSFSPTDGETAVSSDANIVITFSEAIQRGTGSIILRDLDSYSNGRLGETFDAASSDRLSISGSTLTIDPSSPLDTGHYSIQLSSGAIQDVAGNFYVGNLTQWDNAYDFMVADTRAPTVSSFSPTDGATGVDPFASIVITFSEAIQRGTGSIILKNGEGTTIETFDAGSSDRLSISGSTLTIDPSSSMLGDTNYSITLASGTITDLEGFAYAGTSPYDFTTGTASGIITCSLARFDHAQSVTLSPDGKIVVAGYSGIYNGSNAFSSDFSLIRLNSNGSLDTTFSGDGKVIVDVGGYGDEPSSVIVQPDGKIVMAGYSSRTEYGTSCNFSLIRLNADGSLDTTFSGDGKAIIDVGGDDSSGRSVILQPDGKIVVAGYSSTYATVNASLIRLNADGSLDTTFSGDGKAIIDVGGGDYSGRSVILQPDGKIVVGCNITGYNTFSLIRLNVDGSLDTTFSVDGRNVGDHTVETGNVVTLQPDGKVLVAGSKRNVDYTNDFSLTRFNADGSLDGRVIVPLGAYDCSVGSVILQPDGKIVEVGYMTTRTFDWRTGYGDAVSDLCMVRINADGSLDTTFSGDGKVIVDIWENNDNYGYSATLQPDGKIVVVGGSPPNNLCSDFSVIRFNADGSLDTSFGGSGGATTATVSVGTVGNDMINAGATNDAIDGGAGIDTATFSGNHADCAITKTATGFILTGGGNDTDTLSNIERLQFADCHVALDLDGNAGSTAKILGAVFGSASVSNKTYAGIGIGLLDGGMSYEDLAALAINAAGVSTPQQVVNLLWTNVVGSPPTAGQAQPFVDMLNGGMTIGQLGVLAADTSINQTNINMLGLMQTGLEYV